MQHITIDQYTHDVGVLNCRIADLTTKISKIEAILNELRSPENPKEAHEYIPLKNYLNAGGELRGVKRVKIGIRVYDLLRIEPSERGAFECFFYGGDRAYYDGTEILVYNTLQK